MALLVPNEGEVLMLDRILNVSATADPVLHLYVNDVTPSETDTMAGGSETFTECTETGYAAVTLNDGTPGTWTVSTDGGGTTSATYSQVDFNLTSGPVNVYGYYVTDTAGTTLLWAERFDTTAALGAGGGTVSVTPYIELD